MFPEKHPVKNKHQNKLKLFLTKSHWSIFVIRLVIGGVFIYASIDKIMHPDVFAKIIHNYHLLHPGLINLLAITLPWFELVCGVCLVVGYKYRGATLILLIMLAVFIFALSINYARGININCGCFSTSRSTRTDLLWGIIEDIILIAGCTIILFKSKFKKQENL
ncbi:MAG: DoxX family protein [Candidatus Zixiibacteriota bacterium]|nr:MAG: DoxX family protein [candidate division Zixibacteria bacterium]